MFFFFSSRRRHTRWTGDWSSDVCSSDLEVPAGVAKCVLGGLTGLVEPLPRVLAQRLEQEEALVAERLQQAVIEERGELVELRSCDRLGGVETEGAAEDRETAEGSPSVGVEEVVAPFDRRAQRPLPLR